VIDVSHLTKSYGTLKAVDDLSFSVLPGEIVGLIGPNGAGKTSTLRCSVGIQRPDAGRITIDGHDIVEQPVKAKRGLAFMADEPQLFEYLTVIEHLRLMARIYKVRDFDARAKALLEELELTAKAHALPSELSRGMKQKVAIACGLLHDPAALVFDEPLTGLDPLGIRRMRETITARGRNGGAVIVSSHMLHLVEEICTRVVIIDHGVKVADGTLADLSTQAELAGAGSTLEQIFLKVTAGDEPASRTRTGDPTVG
jgi:ABC-2 type transport system ATP-binding protein